MWEEHLTPMFLVILDGNGAGPLNGLEILYNSVIVCSVVFHQVMVIIVRDALMTQYRSLFIHILEV